VFQHATVALRPETAEDHSFLRELFLSVREEASGFRHLDPAKRTAVLEQQFAWQHEQYHAANPHGWFTIVTVSGKPVGRLYLDQRPDTFHIIDLSLLTEYRGHGIGAQLLKNVQAEATRTQLPIRLWVVADHLARSFYDRLGFRQIGSNDDRLHLEWQPLPPPGA
jgi:GNAT superfamily N-acetyltransferase